MKQRDNEWRHVRLGDVTSSRFADVLALPRSKAARESGAWSQSAESYLNELLSELIHCRPADVWRKDATDWGTAQEPYAFEAAKRRLEVGFSAVSLPVDDLAYIHHPTEPGIGCSPDGFLEDDGLLEIKCPYNGAKWIAAKRRGLIVPPEYKPQVQGQLWVTRRKWCAFCYFDPRVVSSGLDPLLVTIIDRDDRHIDHELAPRVCAFRDYVRSEYGRLVEKEEPF